MARAQTVVRHLDRFTKLTPESQQKLVRIMRANGLDRASKLLHTSVVTLETLSSPLGGARRETIERLEVTLKEHA
jgi:hypothetical protein